MAVLDPENEFRSGDLDNNVQRKILNRLSTVVHAVETNTPNIVINPGDVDIGAVQLQGADAVTLVQARTTTPAGTDAGLVTRNIPSGTQAVSGTVAVSNQPSSISVDNFPASQTVNGAVSVSGTVAVSNLPATQPVSGTVAVSNFPATQPVSGTVAVSSGTVAVSNFPATQPVSGAVSVSGSVAVSNFPGAQTVNGSVSVSNFPANQVVSDPSDIVNPLFAASRLGLVDGHTAESFHVMGRRAGFNSTTVLQDVGEFLAGSDAFPELTGAESLEVISSSANDTALGTGTRTIRVGYLDTANNLVVSTDISLNGTTPVALAFAAHFILWVESTSNGALGVSAGNIQLRVVSAGTVHEQITAGGNRSLSCRFMVPAGYTGYVTSWGIDSIGTTQDTRLRATVRTRSRTLGTSYVFQSVNYAAAGGSGGEELPYLKMPALTRIKVSTIAGAAPGTNRIDAEFTILLIAN